MLAKSKESAKVTKKDAVAKIKLRLNAYEFGLLEKTVMSIRSCVETSGGELDTVLWLPLKKKLITVNRGPHIDKKSREQFFLTSYSAVLWILPNEQTRDALKSLTLPYGVAVRLQ